MKKSTLHMYIKNFSLLNDSYGQPLHDKYKNIWMNISVGPYINLQDNYPTLYDRVMTLSEVANEVYETDINNETVKSTAMKFLSGVMFFVILMNGLNVVLILLMINTIYPVNFYIWLRWFGIFLLKNV